MRARFVLNETYDSFKELKDLVKEINIGELNTDVFYNIKNLVKDKEKYPLLKDLINSNIGLLISNKIENMDGGFLSPEYYEATIEENILEKNGPFLDKQTAESLHKNFSGGLIVLQWDSRHVLIHELQHAYDNLRSNTKYNISKKAIKYQKTYDKEGETRNTLITYYRLPFEISAFFNQAVANTRFINTDGTWAGWDLSYIDFKREFEHGIGYKFLTLKLKKALNRRFYQYYYKIKEEYEKSK